MKTLLYWYLPPRELRRRRILVCLRGRESAREQALGDMTAAVRLAGRGVLARGKVSLMSIAQRGWYMRTGNFFCKGLVMCGCV